MKVAVFTLKSLRVLLDEGLAIHEVLAGDPVASPDALSVEVDKIIYVIHRGDNPGSRRIVVALQENGRIWPKEADQAERAILERMYILGERAGQTPLRLPNFWRQYKYESLIAFYACRRDLLSTGFRWIVEVKNAEPHDICYWELTSSSQLTLLQNFQRPKSEYAAVVASWSSALAQATKLFSEIASPMAADAADMELSPAEFADVTQNLTRAQWLTKLTPQQLTFVTQSMDHSVKLRGPAGSGKTLSLELKALHEIDRVRERGDSVRVLFVTHSWVLAEEVDTDINVLSQWGSPEELTILPLLAVAQDVLPVERQDRDLDLVGEDSLSGKASQLQNILGILDEFIQGDWLTFRDDVSDALRWRLESVDPASRSAFAWDCMIEFGCVLGADGIFPGVNAEIRYLRLARTPWMMPLPTDADKRLVLYLYERYMDQLYQNGQLSSDQLVNDFLNYLETFAWNVRRIKDGYDLIFVDEFHLFNVQERHLLRYLARSPSEYPKIYMALDPKQSPWQVYSGLADAILSSAPDKVDDEFGEVSSIDLGTVHRFSPEILRLVKHLDYEFPTLNLGADWGPGMSTATSSAEKGPVPIVIRCGSQQAELIQLIDTVRGLKVSGSGTRGQIAVAIVDDQKFGVYEKMVAGLSKNTGLKVSVIASREDIDILQYRRRGLVIGPAEYLAGLQFDSVLIAGLPDISTSFANQGYRRMRFLSLFYLALTRARREARIFVNADYGGVPEVLQRAAAIGLVTVEDGGYGQLATWRADEEF